MTSQELRKKFLEFFEKRGHKIVPSSSLIPDDPSVLLTTAGMQQFKPYFLGKADPTRDFGSKRVTSIQKAFRTSDIDEVGDESHLTFFEMLGHFSFGDYFKKETIKWTYELLTKVFGIAPERISATVFAGDEKIPFDKESYGVWSKFLPLERIKRGGREDNVWGPAGPEGPCGAANEVYVDNLEVATLVFMEYYCDKNQDLTPLPQKGVDVGWGFERLAMVSQNKKNIFETDLFEPLMTALRGVGDGWSGRIVADHARGITFLIADGVRPSNKDQGYILRRLIRRAIPHLIERRGLVRIPDGTPISQLANLKILVEQAINQYGKEKIYNYLLEKKDEILRVTEEEQERFLRVYDKGSDLLTKLVDKAKDSKTYKIAGTDIFILVTTHGFALEWIKDIAKLGGVDLDLKSFDEEFQKHREISRAGIEKKFGGHGLLLDTGELKAADEEELKKVTQLHTATHLLQAALRKILGEGVKQAGSDITAERTRFDFSFDRKLTDEEIKKVEDLVNFAIGKKYQVETKEMVLEDALKSGALHFFKEKYPPKVKVYSMGDFKADPPAGEAGPPEIFSRELCGGPHVKNTSEIGRFKILKQEAVGAGLRRIRATVE